MPIASSDILLKLSITSGAAGNAAAQPDPNASLGKYISTTQLSGTALNNLFDDVSGAESAAGDIEYRCVFVHNNHGSLNYQNAVVYLSAETAGGSSIAHIVMRGAAGAARASPSARLAFLLIEPQILDRRVLRCVRRTFRGPE